MSPPDWDGPGSSAESGTHTNSQVSTCNHQHTLGNRQVSWFSVHQFVEPLLTEVGSFPMLGTPAWCELSDDDPRKLAALFDAAQHHALRVETAQEQLAQASRDISRAADWSQVARNIQQRNEFYAARPYLRRVSA
jgi:Protein of unknown function (DUF2742)